MISQNFENQMNYFAGIQHAMNYETTWSIYEANHIDMQVLSDGARRVFYRFLDDNATTEEILNGTAQEIEVSSLAVNGTVRELWRAAESCFQQAKAQGDWHRFIENFEMQEDGSLELVMGS